MISDESLVVRQPAHGVVAEVDVLQGQVSEPLERGELEEFFEAAQAVVGEVDLAQRPSEGEAVPYFRQPVAAQPQVLKGSQRGQPVHLEGKKKGVTELSYIIRDDLYVGYWRAFGCIYVYIS